jgi:hypothetical protein
VIRKPVRAIQRRPYFLNCCAQTSAAGAIKVTKTKQPATRMAIKFDRGHIAEIANMAKGNARYAFF